MATQSNPLALVQQVCGTIGDLGVSDPIAYFNLLVNDDTNAVSGIVHVIPASDGGKPFEVHVTGEVYPTHIGSVTKIVFINGKYFQSHPPSDVITEEFFGANMAVNDKWEGKGGFVFRNFKEHVRDVVVRSGNCGGNK